MVKLVVWGIGSYNMTPLQCIEEYGLEKSNIEDLLKQGYTKSNWNGLVFSMNKEDCEKLNKEFKGE